MSKRQNIAFISLIIVVLLYIAYIFYANEKFEKNGVYTIAKITNWESAEQGSSLYYEVIYNGKAYSCHSDGGYGNKIGKYYFIKILADDPYNSQGGPLEEEVPDCILKQGVPEGGWKVIPKCEN